MHRILDFGGKGGLLIHFILLKDRRTKCFWISNVIKIASLNFVIISSTFPGRHSRFFNDYFIQSSAHLIANLRLLAYILLFPSGSSYQLLHFLLLVQKDFFLKLISSLGICLQEIGQEIRKEIGKKWTKVRI